MNVIRTIERWVPRYGMTFEPTAQLVEVRLLECLTSFNIMSPWACVDARNGLETTDEQMIAVLSESYATQEEALAAANRHCPFWYNATNQEVIGKLYDARRWHGMTVGDWRLADAIDVSEAQLRALALGKVKATRKQASAAKAWGGGKA